MFLRKKMELHEANEMFYEFILSINISYLILTTMKIIPCIVNNHNNTFTKQKKFCFQLEKKERNMRTICLVHAVSQGETVASQYHFVLFLGSKPCVFLS